MTRAPATLFVIVAQASRLLAAETVEPLTELPLDAASVLIELYNADVDIVSDPTAQGVLRARFAGDEPAPARLEHFTGADGILEIRRPADAGAEALRMQVDVVVGAEQKVHVDGRDLRVVARESQHVDVTAPLGLSYSLESSQLDLDGGLGTVVEAQRSSLWITRPRGLLTLTLEAGTAEIRDLEGHLKLEARGTEVTLTDFRGRLEPNLDGGSLDVRGGSGAAVATADDAVVLLEGWSGSVTLTGSGTTFEGRNSADPRPWELTGVDLQVTLEALSSPVTADLDGGRLVASTLQGAVSVTAKNRADVELSVLAGPTTLTLSADAAARLDGLTGKLAARVNGATLEVDGVARLELTGAGAAVVARQVASLGRLELGDSDLELDLTASRRDAAVRLTGTGRARVGLTAPCRVRIVAAQAPSSDSVGVTGCELRMPGQPVSQAQSRLIYGDRRPVTLTVTLDEGVDLEVEGLP